MKNVLSVALIICIVIATMTPVFAEDNLADKVTDEIKNIIKSSSSKLEEVVDKLGDIIEYTVSKFSDIKESDWFTQTVSKLVGLGIIDGYEDGTFRPKGNIQVDQFIKMIVVALNYEIENGESYWAQTYIDKAKDLKLVKEGEFSDYKRQINRGEIARIIVRAMDENYADDIDEYVDLISDYSSIPDGFKNFVLKAYVKGIITGYPDGTFRAQNKATRAEASTMLIRMLDESERKMPEKPSNEIPKRTTKLTKEDIDRLQAYECLKYSLDGKIGELYTSFEDMYQNRRANCEHVIKSFNPKSSRDYKGKTEYTGAEIGWTTSPKLVYKTLIGDKAIRGVIQLKYSTDNNKFGLEADKWYECDIEFRYSMTTDGNYISKIKYLSNWRMVK
ncbi:S-layer homology domain-containing protein [Wukongibacter baidiensis]